jgi:hypothetical protein
MKTLILALLLLPCAAGAQDNLLMGSVVKSDKWKMDRTRDQEIFDGNVSFRNPHYIITPTTRSIRARSRPGT